MQVSTFFRKTSKATLAILLLSATLFSCGDREQMLCQLEQAEQQNRDYVPFTTDSLALVLTDYFDSHGTPNERMRAHYILGCAYRDLGEAPRALECYNDAVECADTTATDCDFKTLSRVHGQMANLFVGMTAPKLGLHHFKEAMNYSLLSKDTLSYAVFYEKQVGPYWLLNQKDSIIAVSDSAMRLYKRIGQSEYAATTRGMIVDIYISKGDIGKALENMQIYEKYSGKVSEDHFAATGHEIYYDVKGRLLLACGKIDSAKLFFERLLPFKEDIMYQEAAFRGLLSVYENKKNTDSIAKYAQLFAQTNDSSNIIKSASEITRMQSLYNYSRVQNYAAKKEKEAFKYKRLLFYIVISLLIASTAIYYYYRKRERIRKESLARINTEYSNNINMYNALLHEMKLYKESSEMYIKEKENELQRLKKEIIRYHEDETIIEKWDTEQSIQSSEILLILHNHARRSHRPNQAEWQELIKVAQNKLPRFYSIIADADKELTEQEIIVSILIRLGFIPTEISALFGFTIQRASNLRRKINIKLFHSNDTKQLDKNIATL